MTKISVFQCRDSSGELGDVGDSGRMRCLHGKVDTLSSSTLAQLLLYSLIAEK